MKKILLSSILLFALGSVSMAQDKAAKVYRKPAAQKPASQTPAPLTDEQIHKAQQIKKLPASTHAKTSKSSN